MRIIVLIQMRTIVAVAVMAILVSIVAVGTIAVTDNIDARTKGSESVAAGSSSVVQWDLNPPALSPCALCNLLIISLIKSKSCANTYNNNRCCSKTAITIRYSISK